VDGVAWGILTTWLLWLAARTLFRARLVFSPQVGVVPSPYAPSLEKMRYRVKVKNVSLFRGVADVRFSGFLVARGLDPSHADRQERLRLDLSTDGAATLGPGRNRLITLRFSGLTDFMRTNMQDFGRPVIAGLEHVGLRPLMERLAAAGDVPLNGDKGSPYVEVLAQVTESWTGKQYVVSSPRYRWSDLREGEFRTDISRVREVAMKVRKAGRRFRERMEARQRGRHSDLRLKSASGQS